MRVDLATTRQPPVPADCCDAIYWLVLEQAIDAVMKDQQLKQSLANQKFSKIAEASCANSNNPVEKCLETNPHCIKK